MINHSKSNDIVLNDHQIIPVNFMKDHNGIILYHSTGAGKTLTALYSVYQFDEDIIIIGNKSSKKTFLDNISKANMKPHRFTFYTYSKIKKILESEITMFKNYSVIVDEAHTIRNENMHNLYIASALGIAKRVVLLTATPIINYMSDLAVLVNIVKKEDILPTDRKLFDQMFYDEESMTLINEKYLSNKISNCISYYRANDQLNYPTSQYHYIEVEMNHSQINEYVFYINKIIFDEQIVANNLYILDIDYSALPSKKRNFFLNVTRQLSNTVKNSEEGPKIKEIFNKIVKGPYPIVVYSNFLKNGIYTLAILLEKNNISYKSITGYTTHDKLEAIVNNYNSGLYKVLLISSAGSESLDLKNTRQIHIMEPHWNDAKIQQVIGRAIRYKSHNDLSPKDRHVDIYYWISIFPQKIKNKSADQYLIEISKKKRDLFDRFKNIIIKSSIEENMEHK